MSDNEPKKEVEVFDPQRLKKELQARVRDQFMQVIPDEQWDAMIEAEIKAFFTAETPFSITEHERDAGGDSWGSRRIEKYIALLAEGSIFRQLVFQALTPLVRKRIEAVINDEKFCAESLSGFDGTTGLEMDDGVTKLSDWYRELLTELAPKMAEAMFASVFTKTAQNTRNLLLAQANDQF